MCVAGAKIVINHTIHNSVALRQSDMCSRIRL
jgi:hypothetical protein